MKSCPGPERLRQPDALCAHGDQDPGACRPKLSKRVYFALIRGEPLPYELMRWRFAERFGWTLEYIDTLTYGDFEDYAQVMDGYNKAMSFLRAKK